MVAKQKGKHPSKSKVDTVDKRFFIFVLQLSCSINRLTVTDIFYEVILAKVLTFVYLNYSKDSMQ